MTINDAIGQRQSVRSFTDHTPEVELLRVACQAYPLLRAIEPLGSGRIGTYGIISGHPAYVAVLAGDDLNAGIQGEQLVLDLTQQGYATCWLGGTFNKSVASEATGGRNVRAVIAVGHAAKRRSFVDRIMCAGIKARTRKPLEDLILSGSPSEAQLRGLQAARLAPSACNRQPWRFAFRPDGAIDVYATPSDSYMLLDAGIGIAHFLAQCPDYTLTPCAGTHHSLTPIATLLPQNG